MKIAITTSSFAKFSDAPLRLLREKGCEWVTNPYGRVLSEEEAKQLLQGCDGVVAGTEPLTAAVMDALPGLRAISRCGVGMDGVDLEAAKQRGILVRNTPDAPTRAVAELTLAFALDLMRQISRMDRELRSGEWKKRMGNLLMGKRLGIIGFGRIGRSVAALFSLMGCEIAFFDPMVHTDVQEGEKTFQYMEKPALLAWADIISLHCSKPTDGSFVLDATAIRSMKKSSCLINAARGGIVDEAALLSSLQDASLSGAALDVFSHEPYTGPLKDLPQVVLSPHVGSYAVESRIHMETESVKNLLEALGL